jgi:NAD(P)-dependent dehydrogenase (short-subunit alcohol dehydrogenase family)
VLITGGSEGLGKAIARLLVREEQAKKVTLWGRSEKKLAVAKSDLDAQDTVHTDSVDVTSWEQVERGMERIEECPDVVFCCAGTT